MNVAELLASIEPKVERFLGTPKLVETDSKTGVKKYKQEVLLVTGASTMQSRTFNYFVLNEGVVAGLQVDADGNPVYTQVPVLDGNGDPVLDAEGEPTYTDGAQIDIAAENAEFAWSPEGIPLPKDDNALGMAYLAGKVAAGDIMGFEMVKSRADLSVFSFFVVEVMVPVVDDQGNPVPFTVRPELWRVQKGPSDTVYHVVITA